MQDQRSLPVRRHRRRLIAALVPMAGLLASPGAFAQTDASRTFQIPADVARPCLSYATSDETRLLVSPRAGGRCRHPGLDL